MRRQIVTLLLMNPDIVALGRRPRGTPFSTWVVALARADVVRAGSFPGEAPHVCRSQARGRISIAVPGDLVPAITRRRGKASIASYLRGVLRSVDPATARMASAPAPPSRSSAPSIPRDFPVRSSPSPPAALNPDRESRLRQPQPPVPQPRETSMNVTTLACRRRPRNAEFR